MTARKSPKKRVAPRRAKKATAKKARPKRAGPKKATAKKAGPQKAPAKPASAKRVATDAASGVGAGDAAPSFALRDQSDRVVKLSDFAGERLLVYFYPKADTPGCTAQSCSVRDHRKDLGRLGVRVVGISPDRPASLARFDAKYGLGFPLLSDPDHAVADAFGAWGEKSMYGRKYMGIVRSAFLVDERGRIAQAWRGVKPADTVPNVLEALRT